MKHLQFFTVIIFLQISLLAQYQISINVFGNGGGAAASSEFQISSTAGQTFIGSIEGESYTMQAGFWQPVQTLTSVKEATGEVPNEYRLFQNYPNPFNPSTTIRYSIPHESFVTIKVYDIIGREIAALVNERKQAGNYSLTFNAINLSSGVYFYRIQADGFTDTKKFILIK